MLTVGFDATAAARQSAGIGRYTRQLLDQLARQPDLSMRVFYSAGGTTHGHLPDLPPTTRVREIPLSDRVTNAIWHRVQLPLPVQLILGNLDLFHSPDFTAPPTLRKPRVITIHDLAFLTEPNCAYPTLRAYLERVVPRSARRAQHIIAVSDNTRRDVIDHFNIAPEKVTTVYEAAGPEFYPAAEEEIGPVLVEMAIRRPYLLSVGTLEPRKNYVRLLDAYTRVLAAGSDHDLVIAGRHGWMFEPVLEAIDKLGLEGRVRIVSPGDHQLRALYSGADAFVYASLYEGFGIPVAEALACATPVACSNTSSLPEVLGNAGLLFDPRDSEQIANAILRLLSDSDLRRDLRRQGPVRSGLFSWERAAAETATVYRVAGHG